ncbi:MAG: hypothetical protein ACJARD_000974 [Alphaproteobacteria bacterium]|jgi:hypothetical protein
MIVKLQNLSPPSSSFAQTSTQQENAVNDKTQSPLRAKDKKIPTVKEFLSDEPDQHSRNIAQIYRILLGISYITPTYGLYKK